LLSPGNDVRKPTAETQTSMLVLALILTWQSRPQPNEQQRGIRGYSHAPVGILPFSLFPNPGQAVFFLALSPSTGFG